MHQQTIEEIVKELDSALVGRSLGKLFQLSPLSLAMDFGLGDDGHLFLSADPAAPRIYLIRRRARDLKKQSLPPLLFVQAIRSKLGDARLLSITKEASERIVRLSFHVQEESGESNNRLLVAQLTGRSANFFLLDGEGLITDALRPPRGDGQQIGEVYDPPRSQARTVAREGLLQQGEFATLCAAADDYYLRRESALTFASRAEASMAGLRKELAHGEKLKRNLKNDLIAHGDSEQHKRIGNLLLANITTVHREGNKIRLKDYYSEGEPEMEIEVDEGVSLQDEAARYFARYTKAKRAAKEITTRLGQAERETSNLEARKTRLKEIIASCDEAALAAFLGPQETVPAKGSKRKQTEKIPGVRRYRSSDGHEILVGRASHTNDKLTFRVARPNDLWLHAADYPGSHVIIRNQTRSEIPHRTIIEAAQLAAKFSQAGDDSKVTVHYTPRKFISKPRGAGPGLVGMSSFKTITVRPAESIERL